jgi:hypothetical protein
MPREPLIITQVKLRPSSFLIVPNFYFTGTTRSEFEDHMTCHFEHICPHCDYKSRTEGRLKRHIKDFHTEEPLDGFGSKRNMGRPKVFRCKQCDFVATEKVNFSFFCHKAVRQAD